MSCEGAKERRDGLIADMVQLRELLTAEGIQAALTEYGVKGRSKSKTAVFGVGYLMAATDRLAAAVIALAGPCCENCDEKPPQSSVPPVMPPQGWENPDHNVMADLREAHDGILADRDGAPDE